MPADGIVMAKEAFRLVEQLQAYQGEEVLSYLFHAFGTNLQFEEDEFNFVKARAQHGTKRAFELRDAHFEVPEPELDRIGGRSQVGGSTGVGGAPRGPTGSPPCPRGGGRPGRTPAPRGGP